MLYYLNIENTENNRSFFTLRGRLISERRSGLGITLKQYTYRGGRIDVKRLNRLFKSSAILMPEGVELPDGCTFTKFRSNELSKRLCVNTALELLRRAGSPENLRLGIYDPEAEAPDLMFEALKFCRRPVAVTCDPLPYRRIAQRALYELGASAVITRITGELWNCDLIIAPTEILIPLPIKNGAVVLTAGEPRAPLGGRVYPRYTLSLPEELESLRPPGLDAEYFCSALYSLCRLYPLGSAVPLSCRNSADSQTVDSLINLLDIGNKKAYNS